MISLILSESSLELVPDTLQDHPSVVLHARNLRKHPSEILLDNSWHFAAMKGIKNELKRGRPDLVHFSILEAVTSPLYIQNKMNLFVHTLDEKVIYFGQNIRIPKSYHRFEGLIEKLYSEKKIMADKEILLEIQEKTFSELIHEIHPTQTIGFSREGVSTTFEAITANISPDACIVIGGFQKGHFSDQIKNQIDHLYSINNMSLDGHVVVARMIYECEKTIFM